jgi:hypothetical protein
MSANVRRFLGRLVRNWCAHVLRIPAIRVRPRKTPSRNGYSEDFDSSGYVRDRVALGTLVRNKCLETERVGGELRIRLGEWAKKIREAQ